MKQNVNIFTRIICATSLMAVLSVVPVVANAALSQTGCDDEYNEYINPELALCSTHVYNIGATTNDVTDTQRQIMRDVVALKTTVITQQMYAQYELLDNTIKRLKTQLQKQVLLDRLNTTAAATTGVTGGASASSGDKFVSTDKNVVIAGAENCRVKGTPTKIFECLQNNYTQIYRGTNGGTKVASDMANQLKNDFEIMCSFMPGGKEAWAEYDDYCKNSNNQNNAPDCKKRQTGRTEFGKCLERFNAGIVNANAKLESQNRTTSWGMPR